MNAGDVAFSVAMDLYEEWNKRPPLNEAVLMLVSVFTDWEQPSDNTTPAQAKENIRQLGGSALPLEALPEWVRLSMQAWETETQGKPN